MTDRPHLRREVVLTGPAGEDVYAWSCRTLGFTGFGQHWKTAHDMWLLAVATPWPPETNGQVFDSTLFSSAHTDRTLQ